VTTLWIFKYFTWLYLFYPCCRLSRKQPLYPAALCHLYVNWVTVLTITLKCLNILMVFTWELSAKNNSLPSLCVAPCSFHALVRKSSPNNVRSTYLQLHSFFHYLAFIVVLSSYLPGQRPAVYMFHEYITGSFCLAHQSRHWWEWISMFAFPWKHWEYWVLLLKRNRYLTLICHWLNYIIVLWYILNVLDYGNSMFKFW